MACLDVASPWLSLDAVVPPPGAHFLPQTTSSFCRCMVNSCLMNANDVKKMSSDAALRPGLNLPHCLPGVFTALNAANDCPLDDENAPDDVRHESVTSSTKVLNNENVLPTELSKTVVADPSNFSEVIDIKDLCVKLRNSWLETDATDATCASDAMDAEDDESHELTPNQCRLAERLRLQLAKKREEERKPALLSALNNELTIERLAAGAGCSVDETKTVLNSIRDSKTVVVDPSEVVDIKDLCVKLRNLRVKTYVFKNDRSFIEKKKKKVKKKMSSNSESDDAHDDCGATMPLPRRDKLSVGDFVRIEGLVSKKETKLKMNSQNAMVMSKDEVKQRCGIKLLTNGETCSIKISYLRHCCGRMVVA